MWHEAVMFILQVMAAFCALAVCGPCVLAVARRLVASGDSLQEAELFGCDEPACPYYKKNLRFLMVPAARRPQRPYTSPAR